MSADCTTPDAAIRTATEKLSAYSEAFAARFETARNMLLRGGWSREPDTLIVTFADGYTVSGGECSCRVAGGNIVCLHEIGVKILAIADRLPREAVA